MKEQSNDLLGISIFSLIVFIFTFIAAGTSLIKAEPSSPYKTSVWGVVINKNISFKSKVSPSLDQKRWHPRKLDKAASLQEARASEKNSLMNIH